MRRDKDDWQMQLPVTCKAGAELADESGSGTGKGGSEGRGLRDAPAAGSGPAGGE